MIYYSITIREVNHETYNADKHSYVFLMLFVASWTDKDNKSEKNDHKGQSQSGQFGSIYPKHFPASEYEMLQS